MGYKLTIYGLQYDLLGLQSYNIRAAVQVTCVTNWQYTGCSITYLGYNLTIYGLQYNLLVLQTDNIRAAVQLTWVTNWQYTGCSTTYLGYKLTIYGLQYDLLGLQTDNIRAAVRLTWVTNWQYTGCSTTYLGYKLTIYGLQYNLLGLQTDNIRAAVQLTWVTNALQYTGCSISSCAKQISCWNPASVHSVSRRSCLITIYIQCVFLLRIFSTAYLTLKRTIIWHKWYVIFFIKLGTYKICKYFPNFCLLKNLASLRNFNMKLTMVSYELKIFIMLAYWICYVGVYNFVRHYFVKLHYFTKGFLVKTEEFFVRVKKILNVIFHFENNPMDYAHSQNFWRRFFWVAVRGSTEVIK